MKLPRVIPAPGMIIPVLVLVAAGIWAYNNNVLGVQKFLGPKSAA